MPLLLRPSVLLYALQSGAVVGYTADRSVHVPELTIDHCAPLVKNLPVLGCVIVLWLAEAGRPSRRAGRVASARIANEEAVRPRPPSPRFARHSGRASLASTVARGGVLPAGTHASQAAFMPSKSAMSARKT